MKKILEVIEAIKMGSMITGIMILFGCGLLILCGLIDVAIKSAVQYVCLYIVIVSIICTIESVIKLVNKKKEDEED